MKNQEPLLLLSAYCFLVSARETGVGLINPR